MKTQAYHSVTAGWMISETQISFAGFDLEDKYRLKPPSRLTLLYFFQFFKHDQLGQRICFDPVLGGAVSPVAEQHKICF